MQSVVVSVHELPECMLNSLSIICKYLSIDEKGKWKLNVKSIKGRFNKNKDISIVWPILYPRKEVG